MNDKFVSFFTVVGLLMAQSGIFFPKDLIIVLYSNSKWDEFLAIFIWVNASFILACFVNSHYNIRTQALNIGPASFPGSFQNIWFI
jgi:hypothetical protein